MARPTRPSDRGRLPAGHDRRRAARDRNRLAVVDALLDCYADGNLRPSAQELATRSGVSRRSVFRYFADLDELARVAIERQLDRLRPYFELPGLGAGPLEARIRRLVAQRMALFAVGAPAMRVARLRAPRQPVIAEQVDEARRTLTAQLRRHFAPELDAMDATARRVTLAGAEALTSFETYDLLLATGRSPAAVRAAVRHGLTSLFAPAGRGNAGSRSRASRN